MNMPPVVSPQEWEDSPDGYPRTPLYEEGPCVNCFVVHRPVRAGVAVVGCELCSSLYRLLEED